MFITTFITTKKNFNICVRTIRQYINGICTYYLQQGTFYIYIYVINLWSLSILGWNLNWIFEYNCEAQYPLESVPQFRRQYFKPHKYEWDLFKLKKIYLDSCNKNVWNLMGGLKHFRGNLLFVIIVNCNTFSSNMC